MILYHDTLRENGFRRSELEKPLRKLWAIGNY